MRVLLVEDSVSLSESISMVLRKYGHAVDVAHDGIKGSSYARLNPYDVIVLDIMLPGIDGLQVLRELREAGSLVHVLMLTARDAVSDRVAGLETGADDYLVKPFAIDELIARIEALGRRAHGTTAHPVLSVSDLEIDTAARVARRAGHALELTRRDYSLLLCLAQRAGQVVSRIEIEDSLYDEHHLPASNVVASAISTLRDKLEAHGPRLIHTRHRIGYVLEER